MEFVAVFRILIAYEDFEAGIQARTLASSLSDRLGPDCRIEVDTWKFELIGHHRLQDLIARATGETDMIIIAARDDLPAYVKGWLEAWASSQRSEPVVLVALHNLAREETFPELPVPTGRTQPDQAPPLLEYLRQVTGQNHVDFFWCGKDSTLEPLSCLESGFHQRQEAVTRRDERLGVRDASQATRV